MNIDDFAPNLSFFFSNGLDPEYTVTSLLPAERVQSCKLLCQLRSFSAQVSCVLNELGAVDAAYDIMTLLVPFLLFLYTKMGITRTNVSHMSTFETPKISCV